MSLFRNIVFVAALAGLVAGLVMTGMQYATTVPLILKAETFEKASVSPQAGGGGHDHAVAGHDHSGAAVPSHPHDQEEEWAPGDVFERSAFTALANVVTAIGFALLLVSVSEFSGGMTG